MAHAQADAAHNLLFGLLALQNGMINQDALLVALHAWTKAKNRPMAEILSEQGAITGPRRILLEALVAEHLAVHGGDPEKSIAALQAGRSTRESLARLGDPDIEASLGHVDPVATEIGDFDRTTSYSVGAATSDGQRFRVLRPHARGGLGAVFVALDTELNREVALKQILDRHADDETSRKRFLLEAEITGGLEHPGIVPVYGLGTYGDGRPYYAMRFIRGDSLKEAIERFHTRPTGSRRPGTAQASPPLHGRLQCHRLRPQPRRAAPRHQAGEHHRRQARRDAGGRLGSGQGHRQERSLRRGADLDPQLGQRIGRDAAWIGPGHSGLYEPGAGPGRARPAGTALRCLQPGRHPLLPADRPAALRGRRRRCRAAGGAEWRAPSAPAA